MDENPMPEDVVGEGTSRREEQTDEILEQLTALAEDLGDVIRRELRAALEKEFQFLGDASARTARALAAVRRTASLRIALWAIGVTLACSVGPAMLALRLLPTSGQLERLRRERDRLAASVALLEKAGDAIELRRCGPAKQLCVRVQRTGPVYGPQGDFLIVKDR